MTGWGLQRILDVNVPNNVDSFAPLQLFFDVWCEILSCVLLEGFHTNRFDHVNDCCSIQYNAIHSHIIGCSFLLEFFKAMHEVWLWPRHQVTIFGNGYEKLTWLLKCCYFHLVWCFVRFRWWRLQTCFSLLFHRYLLSSVLSGHWQIHWTVLPLIQQLSSYCKLRFDLQFSSSRVLLGLSILLRKDFLLARTPRLNHWDSLKIAFVSLGFVHGVLSVPILISPSCKATMLRNLSHFSPL